MKVIHADILHQNATNQKPLGGRAFLDVIELGVAAGFVLGIRIGEGRWLAGGGEHPTGFIGSQCGGEGAPTEQVAAIASGKESLITIPLGIQALTCQWRAQRISLTLFDRERLAALAIVFDARHFEVRDGRGAEHALNLIVAGFHEDNARVAQQIRRDSQVLQSFRDARRAHSLLSIVEFQVVAI
jgi:hypothetical protein